jgi:hypothetical protein
VVRALTRPDTFSNNSSKIFLSVNQIVRNDLEFIRTPTKTSSPLISKAVSADYAILRHVAFHQPTTKRPVTDFDIARSVTPRPIQEVAESLRLQREEFIPYGRGRAKISLEAIERLGHRPRGRYILVTAMNPTPLGEGKTTTSIGLAMGLCRLGQRVVVTPRQPSLGPVFGIKGGGTGGGRAQLMPMEE